MAWQERKCVRTQMRVCVSVGEVIGIRLAVCIMGALCYLQSVCSTQKLVHVYHYNLAIFCCMNFTIDKAKLSGGSTRG